MPFESIRTLSGSVAFRIARLFCLTFAVGLAASFVATYFEISYSLKQSSHEVISTKLQEVAAILTHDDVRALRETMASDKNYALNAPFMIRVLDRNGAVVFVKPDIREKDFDLESVFRPEKKPELGWREFDAINDEDVFDLLTEKVGDDYFVQIGRSSEARQEVLERLFAGFSAAAVIMVILSGFIGVWYSRRALKPVRDLLATAQEIEAGDLSRRVVVADAHGELHDLASTFNRMIARIEKVVFVMRDSIDHLAHDMRTPLTRMKAVAEDALLKDSSDQREALSDCAESVDALSSLVEQILSVSEAESGTMMLQIEPVDVRQLLKEVVDLYEVAADDKSQKLRLESPLPDDFRWPLDRKRIKRVIGNLTDNALKFSPTGAEVEIRSSTTGESLKIEVRDNGLGIAADDMPRIWERLFRSDRSRSTKGSGLGLSIARALVEAHGGTISVRSNEGPGVTFTVELPDVRSLPKK